MSEPPHKKKIIFLNHYFQINKLQPHNIKKKKKKLLFDLQKKSIFFQKMREKNPYLKPKIQTSRKKVQTTQCKCKLKTLNKPWTQWRNLSKTHQHFTSFFHLEKDSFFQQKQNNTFLFLLLLTHTHTLFKDILTCGNMFHESELTTVHALKDERVVISKCLWPLMRVVGPGLMMFPMICGGCHVYGWCINKSIIVLLLVRVERGINFEFWKEK